MSRWITLDLSTPEAAARALDAQRASFDYQRSSWEKERRALQKQVSVHVQLREARARVQLLEGVLQEVRDWQRAYLLSDVRGEQADLDTILQKAAKAEAEPGR